MRRHLDAAAVAREPYLVWNAFVDLMATEDYEDMTETQRVAHLAFWYHAEVQNGGHYQYFVNSAGRRASEAVTALRALRLYAQAALLEQAIALWEKSKREQPEDANEFVEGALDGEFEKADSDFHACRPTIEETLEQYLAAHQKDFVVIEGAA
jgi:Domain of unknown function (DUF4375)